MSEKISLDSSVSTYEVKQVFYAGIGRIGFRSM